MTVVLSVPPAGPAPALRLRPWRADDLPALVAAHRDPLLRRWLATSLTGEAEARQWLDAQEAAWAKATRLSFAVVADDRSPLGHVVVKPTSAGTAEVGYWTAAHARGLGIAARAVDTLSHWALGTQDVVALTRLELVHAVGNHPSCRVAVKCGYALHDLIPAAPPAFPTEGHRHVRC
ncbi:GNAT family N-acetyltransferase [Lentzea sp. BCCO 10_0061]|uniref:GNAT family N-acetyltransferase n=1 Tax=Lentzea sokolovensis TaxID=3095429 RepID=A0ABU4V664_9PSEU|nr:GNAT family N-acetyltransferase [Lentzea sp. BCCO 10_0061]MDX8147164.1 GNAT family N-acetyltransferase [Lentzea sp. BCCO 10_0061]